MVRASAPPAFTLLAFPGTGTGTGTFTGVPFEDTPIAIA